MPASDAYALWAPLYPPQPHNPLMRIEQAAVESMLVGLSARRALDVGTGSGRYFQPLRATARFVAGVDLSLPMLRQGEPSRPRVCADARQLPFADGRFDLVSASLMVGDLADLGGWLAEAARMLLPGGHLVYSDFHPEWSTQRWRRTFALSDGSEVELPYFAHTMTDHLDGLSRAGFSVRSVVEPRIEGRASPLLVVVHAVKDGWAGERTVAGKD